MSWLPDKPVFRPATFGELETLETLLDSFPGDARPPKVQADLREFLSQQALMCEAALLPMVMRLVGKL